MTCEEWWWLYDVKRPKNPATDYAGTLTQDDVDELSAMFDEVQ